MVQIGTRVASPSVIATGWPTSIAGKVDALSQAVAANGSFTDAMLPAGTYLFELQQPYGDNTICQRELSRRLTPSVPDTGQRHVEACPRVRLHPFSSGTRASTRLEDGYGIYTYAPRQVSSCATSGRLA